MFLTALGFELSGAPKASIVLLALAWVFMTIAVFRHGFFARKNKRTRLIGTSTISAGMAIIFALSWLSLRPAPANSDWLLPYLTLSLGLFLGSAFTIAIASLIGFMKSWRSLRSRRLKERAGEKGLFDHWHNRDFAEKELARIMVEMTKPIERITKIHQEIQRNAQATARRGTSGKAAKQIADDGAKKIDKMTTKLEKCQVRFAEISDLLIESDTGMMGHMNEDQLRSSLASYQSLKTLLETYAASIKVSRDAQLSLRGYSQELTSAIDGLVRFLDDHLGAVTKVEQYCQNSERRATRLLDELAIRQRASLNEAQERVTE